jgi:hypothetical protein
MKYFDKKNSVKILVKHIHSSRTIYSIPTVIYTTSTNTDGKSFITACFNRVY